MREIKFRQWNPLRKEMQQFTDRTDVEVLGDGTVGAYWPKNILMQFTGLHDKTGKEIYEGDILKCDDVANQKYVNLPVIFNDECEWVADDGAWKLYFGRGVYKGRFEVIGNIYDHGYLIGKYPDSFTSEEQEKTNE
jgi:uncharacterized phage protein (TIGR01671 family)